LERITENFSLCSCEEEYGINSRPGAISWDLFFGLLGAMVQWGSVPTGMESRQLFAIGFLRIISFNTVFLFREVFWEGGFCSFLH
jgi:hypothetical protein